MHGGVASSGGWIALSDTEFEKTIELERYVNDLKIMWTSDTVDHSYVSVYLNDDSSLFISICRRII